MVMNLSLDAVIKIIHRIHNGYNVAVKTNCQLYIGCFVVSIRIFIGLYTLDGNILYIGHYTLDVLRIM